MRKLSNLKTLLVLLSSASATPWTCLAETVGIVQVIEHPALNATRQGIIDFIKENIPNATVTWDSAQGNPSLAVQVTQKYLGQKTKVVVAIGTTPAQNAVRLCERSQTPVIFASVTDPVAAKLTGNVSGVSNFVALAPQLRLMQEILPNLKKIGLIYNPGEVNSEILLAKIRQEATKLNLEIIALPATKTSDVMQSAKQLATEVDCIFINNDNTALASFKSIVQAADAVNIPVFASDSDMIDQGALAALGPDQYQIGRQAGEMVVSLLKGTQTVSELEVAYPKQVDLYLNHQKARALNILLPDALCKRAKRIKS